MPDRKIVGLDDILAALRIREAGGTWYDVIDATGFNGATLRPHINRYLARDVVKKTRQVTHDDRVDSPYAIVVPVELSTESIDKARLAGMSWYGIAEALGVSEAKVKGLASPEAKGRIYARAVRRAVEAASTEERGWAWPEGLEKPFENLAPIVAKAARARSAKGRAKAWSLSS